MQTNRVPQTNPQTTGKQPAAAHRRLSQAAIGALERSAKHRNQAKTARREETRNVSLKPNLVDRFGSKRPSHNESNRGPTPDETSAKVSRLATAASISAFIATGCLIFAFVTHSQASTALASAKADLKTVVVAAKQIPSGTTVSADMLTTAEVPAACLGDDAVFEADEVVGKQSVVRISENRPVHSADLTRSDGSSSLAGKISKGKKAVSINVTTETDFSQSLLHQGDRVSLYSFEDGTKKKICEDVEELALDGYTSYADLSRDGVFASYSTVTVEVTKSTAEAIRELQSKKTTIWMILTATADVRH